jgi:hypothetical protein
MSIVKEKFPDFEEIIRLRDIEHNANLYLKTNTDKNNFFNEYISTVQDPDILYEEILKFT